MKSRTAAGLFTGWLLATWGVVLAATPAQILQFRPRQEGIHYSTPAAGEVDACKVKWTKNPQRGGVWLLTDPQGRPLRRLVDTVGDNKPHIWSYYLDGVEVYREIDSGGSGEPDQYRWLNAGGMKWGVDVNKDHKIDTWRMISIEEVSQEILQSVVTRDFNRLRALFISEAEVKGLGLPAADTAKIQNLQKQAFTKFQNTVNKLTNINDKTRWVHLDTSGPECLPADAFGGKQDIIRYARGSILFDTDGKNDFLQTGEMIKVGLAWRIVDAPTPGDAPADAGAQTDPAVEALLTQLRDHDAKPPRNTEVVPNPEIVNYNLVRANILEQIEAKVKQDEREQWIRQIADCLSAAAQNSPETDKVAYQRLMALEQQIMKAMPGTPLAAYVVFREMSADNAAKMSKPGPDIGKVQEQWVERLAKFVQDYPKGEDTAEALMQLGMVSEFMNKEAEAKKWYAILVKSFADHPLAAKASGALRRLDLEGKPLELAGTLLNGGPFDMVQLRGKLVVVYYWASWNQQRCVADFALLKQLMDTYAPKGLALVCVNLDNTAEEAAAFLQRSPAPGLHVFQPGGLDSPLATQYGVMVLPNLFLVDKDGKVLSRTVQQVGSLEDEVKKVLK
jgi:hypothetical protein